MGRNRWPTEYIDPATIRAQGPLTIVRHHAFVMFVGQTRIFVIHVEEFGAAVREDVDEHQTTADQWLRDTVKPRAAPIPGFEIDLAPALG